MLSARSSFPVSGNTKVSRLREQSLKIKGHAGVRGEISFRGLCLRFFQGLDLSSYYAILSADSVCICVLGGRAQPCSLGERPLKLHLLIAWSLLISLVCQPRATEILLSLPPQHRGYRRAVACSCGGRRLNPGLHVCVVGILLTELLPIPSHTSR